VSETKLLAGEVLAAQAWPRFHDEMPKEDLKVTDKYPLDYFAQSLASRAYQIRGSACSRTEIDP
jgi:hypothetical protein